MGQVNIKGKGRLFKNPILEALSRTSPGLTLGFYLPMSLAVMIVGIVYFDLTAVEIIPLSLLGMLVWTFTEYIMHRFLFHFVHDSKAGERFHYMAHGVHHDYPKDVGRLFMPPTPGLFISAFWFGLFYLIMGTYVFAFFPGFVLAYLGYVFTHYAIHSIKKPRNAWGYMWDHHNTHHFRYPDKAFGVSSPLWDVVFGTMPPKK